MPKGSDWLNFFYVNLGFIVQVLIMYVYGQIKEIKDNWPKYRCNPMYMPLSDDMSADFTYCVQNMQTSFMGVLLQPLTYVANSLTSLGGEFTQSLDYARNMMGNIRTFITNIIEAVYGIFLNIIIQFQIIIIKMKDLVGKVVGIVVTLMYILEGTIHTSKSTWNGPPGEMIRTMGHCFHPETKIKLKDGSIQFIKDLNLGDYLENGSRVNGIMKLDNTKSNHKIYKIKGKGVNGDDIFVTGSHMILDNGRFIEVKDYKEAIEQDEVKSEWLSCLIIDDHKIKIGDKIFWDWDDYIIKNLNKLGAFYKTK
jgi:hypothetical protein